MKSLRINFRRALLFALLCFTASATMAARAQKVAPDEWVKVAPQNEEFTVVMPRAPFPLAENRRAGSLVVAGQRYSLRQDKAEYTVWSFKVEKLPDALGEDTESYLDQCAEIAWDLLIEPYWKKIRRDAPGELFRYNLDYEEALDSAGYPGRSYLLNLGDVRGLTHIYAVGSRVYIVSASSVPSESSGVERFVKSFALTLQPAPDASVVVAAVGTGRGSNESVSGNAGGTSKELPKETDYSRIFTTREVTQRASITGKPEPSYTESARKFGVTGAVRVRAILAASGKVTQVTPISKLPHELTQKAVEAAQKIKFKPAVKDGHVVSQYVTIEYNFHIY
ncbi:MAG TPA: energy transducer TonB [Pyrinomonadaceae bacterium]|nr:energy transducer TonB [Pyrinomonadaceae bacterium]